MTVDLITFPGKVPPPPVDLPAHPDTPDEYLRAAKVVQLPRRLPEAAREAIRWLKIARYYCGVGKRFSRKDVQGCIDEAIRELMEGGANSRKMALNALGPDLLGVLGLDTNADRVTTLKNMFSALYYSLCLEEGDDDPNSAA